MERHPLDPIALVGGILTVVGGVIALLHQLGAFDLGPGPVALISCIAFGAAGAVLVLLLGRSPAPEAAPDTAVEEPAP